MNRIRRMVQGRNLFVLAAAAFVAVGVFVASLPSAEAIVIAPPSVCSYYKDASYRKVVGARGTGCCGEVINWGVITPYYRCEKIYCLDVLCPF